MRSSWNQIDLVVLSRDDGPLPPDVERGIRSQQGVDVQVHRVVGTARPGDRNRWDTIVRARNQGKQLGREPWLMFLDDDVVLEENCMATLLTALRKHRYSAAVAADYLQEAATDRLDVGWGPNPHVGMGATLFRRAALEWIEFRWQPGQCECQCCCDDLRRQLWTIDYVPHARAWHRKGAAPEHPAPQHSAPQHSAPQHSAPAHQPPGDPAVGHVLAAFNRAHFRGFRDHFIRSLRATGNREPVTAVTYGLHPNEVRALAMLPNVRVVALPENGMSPPVRRLLDFQQVVAQLPAHTCVAYWDAGDVQFQGSLQPLWALVQQNPNKLLVVAEAKPSSEHPLVHEWTHTIRDAAARDHAMRVLRANPYLNSGFAAGRAPVLLKYLQAAHQLQHSPAIEGSLDWGDQTAMNVYCHTDPSRREIIRDDWNYLLAWRRPGEVQLRSDYVFTHADGAVIPVIHGAGKQLEPFWAHQKFFGPRPMMSPEA
jgi:hypothetical protein